MTNISKRPLDPEVSKQLFTQLCSVLGQLDRAKVSDFLADLLGPEERLMLAKRLAAILMLEHGYSIYKTSESLAISTSTAKSIQRRLQSGSYDHLLKALVRKKNRHILLELLEAVDDILHLGGLLPHYNGPDRSKRSRPDVRS